MTNEKNLSSTGPAAESVLLMEAFISLVRIAFGFHSFQPGVEVVEDVAGSGVEDAADEDVGHGADVLRVFSNESTDSEITSVVSADELTDPIHSDAEIVDPLAELCTAGIALLEAFDHGIGGELTRLQGEKYAG